MLQLATLTLVFHVVLRNYSPHLPNDNHHNTAALPSPCGRSWLVKELVQGEKMDQQTLGLIALWDIPFWLRFSLLLYTEVSGAHGYFPLIFFIPLRQTERVRHSRNIRSRNFPKNLLRNSIRWNCWAFSGVGIRWRRLTSWSDVKEMVLGWATKRPGFQIWLWNEEVCVDWGSVYLCDTLASNRDLLTSPSLLFFSVLAHNRRDFSPYTLNVWLSSWCTCWNSVLNEKVLGGGLFSNWLGHEGRNCASGPFSRGLRDLRWPFPMTRWRHHPWTRKWAFARLWLCLLILDFLTFRISRRKRLYYL